MNVSAGTARVAVNVLNRAWSGARFGPISRSIVEMNGPLATTSRISQVIWPRAPEQSGQEPPSVVAAAPCFLHDPGRRSARRTRIPMALVHPLVNSRDIKGGALG